MTRGTQRVYAANTAFHRIYLVPYINSPRAFPFEPISCDLRDGDTPLRIGRYTKRSGIYAPNIPFKSQVVSRAHAEIWFNNGKFYIKDTKSSSGTFLNHFRLSPADSESGWHLLKDGDIVQLGVDFEGGKENIHKCVKIRIEVERQHWQAAPDTFYHMPAPVMPYYSSLSVPISQPTAKVSESHPHRSPPGDSKKDHAMPASDGVGLYKALLEAEHGSKQKYRAPSTPDMEWDPTSVIEQGTRIARDSDDQMTIIYVGSPASAYPQQFEEEDKRDENKLGLNEEDIQKCIDQITHKTSTSRVSETAVTKRRTSPAIPHSTSNSPQDLTNQLQGRSNYPVASGDFADIWKCELVKSDETIQVAVKTIRAFESDNDVTMRRNSKRVRRDTNVDFTSQISDKLRDPVTTGSFGEVYRCTVESSKGKKEVAVKVLKIDPTRTTEKLEKAMLRELEIWLKLKHSAIVPLLGTARVDSPTLALVSQWMSSGTLAEYLDEQATIITPSARIGLAKGIAEGLIYLHSENVIHGDLHPANVLIDGSGNPCLADFGLATVAENPDLQWNTTTVGRILDSRWRVPEVLGIDGDPERPTFKSDIYSFGSVMFFIMSGDIPWKEKKHSIQICIELSKRTTPARPQNIFGSHWDLIQQCWIWKPEHRPVATIVRERAEDLI